MADEAAVVEEGISPAQSPLVAVTFQKNVNRKQKYLEGEPKALGITQIGLGLFNITCASVFLSKGVTENSSEKLFLSSSLLVVIAGSVAVAAQNLHLPTLRACFGMQIVACCVSVINVICVLIKMVEMPRSCWYYYDDSPGHVCHQVLNVHMHFCAESVVIQAVLFAISVTLAAYSCKVANCCAPTPRMPVITVQAPPVQQ